MPQISSRLTTWHKKIFPIVWFGILGFVAVGSAASGSVWRDPEFVLGPVAIAVFGYVVMRTLIWHLADYVEDFGDHLLVRNRGDEDRIPLSHIEKVTVSTFTNPPRITLRLAAPSKFGTKIAFIPIAVWTLNPFARHPIARDLTERVARARGMATE